MTLYLRCDVIIFDVFLLCVVALSSHAFDRFATGEMKSARIGIALLTTYCVIPCGTSTKESTYYKGLDDLKK